MYVFGRPLRVTIFKKSSISACPITMEGMLYLNDIFLHRVETGSKYVFVIFIMR